MLAKSVSLSLGLFAAGLVVATPAAAQDGSGAGDRLPAPCRVSAGNDGACSSGLGRATPNRGARPAHAILFFGGTGVRLTRDRPTAAALTAGPAEPTCPLPARPAQPQERPAFTLVLRHN